MSIANLSSGLTAAAFALIAFVAIPDAAFAAHCPLGEIYRPSRGVCVSRAQAIQAGIYHGSHARAAKVELAQADAPVVSEKAEKAEKAIRAEKPRAEKTASRTHSAALAAIESRAPIAAAAERPTEQALAFGPRSAESLDNPTRPASSAPAPVSQIEPKPVKAVPIAFSRPAPSPFGSLVALEPMP